MVDMTCPITGTILHVADEQVEKFEKAGYKRVGEKTKRTRKEKKAEDPEKAEEPENE